MPLFRFRRNRLSNQQKSAVEQKSVVQIEEVVVPPKNDVKTDTPRAQPIGHIISRDWMEAMIQEQTQKGAFDNLPGAGKPLTIDPKEDMATRILKNANALPPWIQLQQDIRDEIGRLLSQNESNQPATDQQLSDINKKISMYNTQCPSPLLQKAYVTQENLHKQYEKWV